MNTTSATSVRSTSMPSTWGASVGEGVDAAGTSVPGGAGGGGAGRRLNRMMPPTMRSAAAPSRARIRGRRLFPSSLVALAILSANASGPYFCPSRPCRAIRALWSTSGGAHPSRFTGITSSLPAFSRKNSSTAGLSAPRFSDRNSTRASPFPGAAPRTVTPFFRRASKMGRTLLSSAEA